MINNEQDNSTEPVANNTLIDEINPSSSSSVDNGEGQSDQNQLAKENHDDDEFIRITAAHQVLNEAQTYDEQQNYPLAIHFYRVCVDFLLEELMFTEGTDQSRIYLHEKCTAVMDRIDLLKTKLDPIPSTDSTEQSTNDSPVDR